MSYYLDQDKPCHKPCEQFQTSYIQNDHSAPAVQNNRLLTTEFIDPESIKNIVGDQNTVSVTCSKNICSRFTCAFICG